MFCCWVKIKCFLSSRWKFVEYTNVEDANVCLSGGRSRRSRQVVATEMIARDTRKHTGAYDILVRTFSVRYERDGDTKNVMCVVCVCEWVC